MEALLYFILWGAFIFLMMRFGCGSHVMGHGHGKSGPEENSSSDPGLRWVPPTKDIDPVCKKTVETDEAKSSVHAGRVYYFCSRECREVFEAAPDLYVSGANQPRLEHSHA
jgi:YHS domain-containing protein